MAVPPDASNPWAVETFYGDILPGMFPAFESAVESTIQFGLRCFVVVVLRSVTGGLRLCGVCITHLLFHSFISPCVVSAAFLMHA